MTTPDNETNSHIDAMVDVLVGVARGELARRMPIAGDNGPLDALAVGVNIVLDELQEHIELLDRRVAERTAELEEKVRTVEAQQATILELAAPVLRVWDGVLVLPLVGTIDAERAQRILETMLEAIVKEQARVAIVDITGVPVVDEEVARHLISAIRAGNLLGAKLVLSGISPRAARSLVALNKDLHEATTAGTLQQALVLALESAGLAVRGDAAR